MNLPQRAFRKCVRVLRRRQGRLPGALRVAVIGAGEISATHVEGFEQSGLAHVAAFADPNPAALGRALDRAPQARAFRDVERMLAAVRPDVVSICTWPQSHAELAELAASAGVRGILCEKPLALTLADNRRIVGGCQRSGTRLAGGHQYRFHPYFIAAAAAIAAGNIGAPRRVRGQIRGSLANNGPHLFDSVRFLLGDRDALRAKCRCQGPVALERGLPAEASARGTLEFEGGVEFEFQTGAAAEKSMEIAVEGNNGTIIVTPSELSIGGRRLSRPVSELMAQCRRTQFGEFLRWVAGRRPGYAAEGVQSSKSAELVLAAYAAARRDAPLDLPSEDDGDVIGRLFSDVAPAATQTTTPSAAAAIPVNGALAMDGGPRAVKAWFSNKPHIGLAELVGTAQVIRSGQLNCVEGRSVATLEHEFARAYGADCAVASTSGTAALHVAVAALDLDPCDEVITTPVSDMGSVIPILSCNLIPVFADIDPATGNLTAESIAEKITPRTRAVILVHLFGRPADLGPIVALCRARGIALIEDCSQAHFAEYDGRKVGTFGDLGCFSLQQAKQITCGDGGLTLVNREDLAERAALFVDKGWNRRKGLRSHEFLGLNYRMTELQAAVARAQIRKLPRLSAARRASAERLENELRAIAEIRLPQTPAGARSAWWKFNFAVDEERLGASSDAFALALATEGVRIVRQYLPRPLFEEQALVEQRTFGRSRFPFSAIDYRPPQRCEFPGLEEFFRRQLIMSWSSRATPAHAGQIAEAVRKVVTAATHRKQGQAHDVALAAN